MDFFLYPPDDDAWQRVQGSALYTKDCLVNALSYISLMKNNGVKLPGGKAKTNAFDTVRRWSDTDDLWRRLSKIFANINIKRVYLETLISQGLDEGVQYWEMKKSFGEKERMYELNSDPEYRSTNGKRYLEDIPGMSEMTLVRDIVRGYQTSTAHLDTPFIGFKRLVQSVRHYPRSRVHDDVTRALYLHSKYPDVIVGFDLAGEEDTGHSSLYHSDAMLMAAEYSRRTGGKFRLVCHAGETSMSRHTPHRPEAEMDTLALSNLYDAVSLNASRIGHGLALAKYPSLLDRYRAAQIAIEVCPVCNHILGYVPDVRNHPGAMFQRSGIPIVLGSDAQGVFGFDYFTVDWYMVYMAWGVGLADIKQLAYQSLYHSSMDGDEKEAAIGRWRRAWDKYISNMVTTICGQENHGSFYGALPNIYSIHPDNIPITMVNNDVDIHVYGDVSTSAICGDIYCQMGSYEPSIARYISMSHLVCTLTILQIHRCYDKICVVELSLSTDGIHYYETGKSVVIHTV